MATTDGTAAFEKRKFADNEKLSVIYDSSHLEGSLSITQNSDTLLSVLFAAPIDGILILRAGMGSGTKDSSFYIYRAGGYGETSDITNIKYNTSPDYQDNCTKTFYQVRKGENLYIKYRNISYMNYRFFLCASAL